MHGTFKANVKPNRKDIASILAAGGATLLSMQEAVAQGGDLAIMPPGTAKAVHKASRFVFICSSVLFMGYGVLAGFVSGRPCLFMLQVS